MNRKEHLLVILGEECCEVSRETAKCLRFSPQEIYPEIKISNAERVMVELHDVLALVEMLQDEGVLPRRPPDRKMIHAKKLKVEKHLEYSRTCGTVTP